MKKNGLKSFFILMMVMMLVVAMAAGCGNKIKSKSVKGTETTTEKQSKDKKDSKENKNIEPTETTVEQTTEAATDTTTVNNQDNTTGNTANTVTGSNQAPAGTPVAAHGALSVSGTHIVDSSGNIFQFKGVSTHGLAWFPQYVNQEAFRQLRDEWGVNVIRLAMYTAEYNGYCTGDENNKNTLKNLIDQGVNYCTNLGMYVIIDWHVLNDCNPNVYKSEAITFFDEMSKKYAGNPNVIFEICNEPNNGASWSDIKSYAVDVVNTIRANSNAIIIIGTPTWSQDVDVASTDPVSGSNLVYALHFYADTHRESIRQKLATAVNNGLPVVVSEFGICDASGSGANNITEADTWINTLNQYGIGYVIWNFSNKNETCALINSNCSKTSGFTNDDFTESAKWYMSK